MSLSRSDSCTVNVGWCFLKSEDIIVPFLTEISGPIILDTYRVVADFVKTSKNEINLHTGDLVEIVEKNQNGEETVECLRLVVTNSAL